MTSEPLHTIQGRVVLIVLLRRLALGLFLLGLRLARQRDVDLERCSTLRDVLALRVLCLDRERRPAGRARCSSREPSSW